jgi:hypothetical protein
LSLLLVGVVVAVAYLLRPTEEAKLLKILDEFAQEASYDAGPPKPSDAIRFRRFLTDHVSDPITLDIEDLGDVRLSLDELTEGYLSHSAEFSKRRYRVNHAQIKLDRNASRASGTGELLVEATGSGGVQRTEPRRFTVTFAKPQSQWLVIHAKITAPRIDEPEARP